MVSDMTIMIVKIMIPNDVQIAESFETIKSVVKS